MLAFELGAGRARGVPGVGLSQAGLPPVLCASRSRFIPYRSALGGTALASLAQVDLMEGTITVGKSKTEGGEGRGVSVRTGGPDSPKLAEPIPGCKAQPRRVSKGSLRAEGQERNVRRAGRTLPDIF